VNRLFSFFSLCSYRFANFFATNIESAQPEDSFAQARKAISLRILKELNIVD
jgi:hypothetical protein